MVGIYSNKEEFDEKGWTFDFVFDQTVTVTVGEALSRVARSVQAQCVVQGGKLCLVRDVAGGSPVMTFGPRNIRRGILRIEYAMATSETSDSLAAAYMDERSWRPVDHIYAFDDSPQENTTSSQLHGVTTREAICIGIVEADEIHRMLDVLVGSNALGYRKLFDGSQGDTRMGR